MSRRKRNADFKRRLIRELKFRGIVMEQVDALVHDHDTTKRIMDIMIHQIHLSDLQDRTEWEKLKLLVKASRSV